MEIIYMCWCLVLMIYMMEAAGQKIELTSWSLGSPDYYINDTLRLNCTTSGYTDVSDQRFYVNDLSDAGCRFSSAGWEVYGLPLKRFRTLRVIEQNYCADYGTKAGFVLLANHKITPNSTGLQIRCHIDINGQPQVPYNNLTISSTLKVAPQGLAFVMTNPDQPVMEGEAFEFRCVTTSASESAYRYDVKRGGIIATENVGDSYTPSQNDRQGFRIVCVDTVHVNWKGGNTTTESQIIYPRYEGMPTTTSNTNSRTRLNYEIIGILALVLIA